MSAFPQTPAAESFYFQPTALSGSKNEIWTGRVLSAIVSAFFLFDSIAKLFRAAIPVHAMHGLGYTDFYHCRRHRAVREYDRVPHSPLRIRRRDPALCISWRSRCYEPACERSALFHCVSGDLRRLCLVRTHSS